MVEQRRFRQRPSIHDASPLALGGLTDAPACAFLLVIAGFLGLYSEFIWSGRVLPGVGGCVFVAIGAYFLWRDSPTPTGVTLLLLAFLLFKLELFWKMNFVAGSAAILALTSGFGLLFPATRRIPLTLDIPVAATFGGITLLLTLSSKRALRNKRADLGDREEKGTLVQRYFVR